MKSVCRPQIQGCLKTQINITPKLSVIVAFWMDCKPFTKWRLDQQACLPDVQLPRRLTDLMAVLLGNICGSLFYIFTHLIG